MRTLNKMSVVMPMLFILISFNLRPQFNEDILFDVSARVVEVKNIDQGSSEVVKEINITGSEIGVFRLKSQVNVGIMAGVSTGAVEMKDIDQGFTDVVKGKNIMGYEMGIFLKLKAGPIYVKPIMAYAYQSGRVVYDGENVAYKANKIAFPILLGLNLVGPLSIEAGPVYNYLLNVTHQFDSYDWDFNKNGLGYRFGLALDFGQLILNLSYEGVSYSLGNSRSDYKEPYKLIFGAALKFGGKD